MTYRLFLDDIRNPLDAYSYTGFVSYRDDHWKVVRNYDQFVDYITRNYEKHDAMPSIIGFDHDLAEQHYSPTMNNPEEYSKLEETFTEKTGMDCAKWLVEFCMDNNLKLPEFFVHSMNPAGGQNILSLLDNYKKHEKLERG